MQVNHKPAPIFMMSYFKSFAALLYVVPFFCQFTTAQINFDIKNKNIAEIRSYETNLKSKPVDLWSTYINPPGIADPVVFERPEKNVPNLWVYYFANAKDSTINNILYEWDDSNFTEDHHATTQPTTVLMNYVNKYKELLAQVSANYGTPETTGSIEDLSAIETGRVKRKDVFRKNGVEVEMYIVLSNNELTNGIVTISPTHRIRLYIRPANS
ncbi:hypothetical protein CKK33_11140 [Mucilaginibacter sp. MD40]|nr:hypothetical protein CKK33_11140 [Mucilaginibacter sp. MD40]